MVILPWNLAEEVKAQQVDPNNRLLARMPRRRLEAEEVRDALLAVSGRLDRSVGGRFFQTLVLIPRISASATSVGMPGPLRMA